MTEKFTRDTSNDTTENKNNYSGETENVEINNEMGYDLYPERKSPYKSSWSELLFGRGSQQIDKVKCEQAVYESIKTSKYFSARFSVLIEVFIYCI